MAMQGQPPQGGVVVQKVGVPTAATLDADMLSQINDITRWVPKDLRIRFFGLLNNVLPMGKLNPRQGRAMQLEAEQMVDYYLMSVPPWEAEDPQLILTCQNMIDFVKVLVRKAVTTNEAMNERAHISAGPNPNPQGSQGQAPRKKLFGIF